MFDSLAVRFGAKVLFNTVKPKPGVAMRQGGFCGGQVLRFPGSASPKGALGGVQQADAYLAIVTHWRSFEEHERSHADNTFRNKFSALATMCSDSQEVGCEML